MRPQSFAVTVLAFAVFALSGAAAQAAPAGKPKPGNWDSEIEHPAMGKMKHSYCVDDRFEWGTAVPQQTQQKCKIKNLKQSANSVSFDSECDMGAEAGGMTSKSSMKITGNLENDYSFTMTTEMSMPGMPAGAMPKTTMKGRSRWTGPCKKK